MVKKASRTRQGVHGAARASWGPATAALALAVLAANAVAQADPEAPRWKPKSLARLAPADPEELNWPLTRTQKGRVTINFPRNFAPTLFCVYSKPGNRDHYRSVTFWESVKPDLRAAEAERNRMDVITSEVTTDVAVPACPATYGAAVVAGWGPNGWDEAQAESRAKNAKWDDAMAKGKDDEKRKRQAKNEAWQTTAVSTAVSTDAEDLALARQIDADIRQMESQLDALNSRPFNDKLVGAGGLFERIDRLAQIAWTKSRALNPAPAGRARFDDWDARLGGPALTAIARLEKIVHYRQNRRVRMNEVMGGDAGASEMKSWSFVNFSPVWPAQSSLLSVFAQHLDGRPLIDPAFQQRVAKDLERTRPSGDPGRPFYYQVPAAPKPTWLMTPEEEEAQGSKITANLFGAITGVSDLIRLIEKADADVRESRVAFWKCYANRCKQAGDAFYAYSHALWTKDNFYFAWPSVRAPLLSQGMSFLGDGSIDGGPISQCMAQGNALAGALATTVKASGGNPIESARGVVATMKGPTYLTWQGCRDRMEYILRPRFL